MTPYEKYVESSERKNVITLRSGLRDRIARWLLLRYQAGQTTFCFCPGCGLELCKSLSWHSSGDLEQYQCVNCGALSSWLFDVPVPILISPARKQVKSHD